MDNQYFDPKGFWVSAQDGQVTSSSVLTGFQYKQVIPSIEAQFYTPEDVMIDFNITPVFVTW